MGSSPIVAMNRPNAPEVIPAMSDFPETPAIMVRPKAHTRKYSGVPIFWANLLTWGAKNSKTIALRIPPNVEACKAMFKAFLAWPRCVRG